MFPVDKAQTRFIQIAIAEQAVLNLFVGRDGVPLDEKDILKKFNCTKQMMIANIAGLTRQVDNGVLLVPSILQIKFLRIAIAGKEFLLIYKNVRQELLSDDEFFKLHQCTKQQMRYGITDLETKLIKAEEAFRKLTNEEIMKKFSE